MPVHGEDQAFSVHVQDSRPGIQATRRRGRSVLETTMVFRTAGDSCARVRAENADKIRISITGPKPVEDENQSEATASARPFYNTSTSVTITHRDVNLALNVRRPRPLIRFVSVGPISEEEAMLHPGEEKIPDKTRAAEPSSKDSEKAKAKVRPVSAPSPSPEVVKAMLDAPPMQPVVFARPLSAPMLPGEMVQAMLEGQARTGKHPEVPPPQSLVPARPSAPLRIVTNPTSLPYDVNPDSDVDSPLQSASSPLLSFRPHQFSGGRSVLPRRVVLDEPLASLCPPSPSESSLLRDVIPEEVEEENVEAAVSLDSSLRSFTTASESIRRGKVGNLTKAVMEKLSSSSSRQTSSGTALGRPSMSPPPSAFQRFERALGAGTGSSLSLASRSSLKSVNGTGRGVKALLGKARAMGKGIKRSREDENVDPEYANENFECPIAGRRIKRKLLGMTISQ
ncbi:hypothetical protein GYMLUDRAFT_437360 [Collybiopsis luxurians FD-317 M1]|uniref:Uncharacterized protein n=1 Tax=Collybiopsis luxurians FD-317 M1 TaxID=944289 RepID=A0A0D0C7R2_9AGAR|nr:hypothetical protein GYMLUDRAFT_437360 [Collybiopsis luxurians FD-317 M1]